MAALVTDALLVVGNGPMVVTNITNNNCNDKDQSTIWYVFTQLYDAANSQYPLSSSFKNRYLSNKQ